jgi:hypothetical protein
MPRSMAVTAPSRNLVSMQRTSYLPLINSFFQCSCPSLYSELASGATGSTSRRFIVFRRNRNAWSDGPAKEDVIYEIFKRVMNTGVTITGALIALLLSIIGYLLVHPVGLH